jgi:Putative antitoxin of bacterial toxin-antitoxin system, YdaS/YdaT
MTPYELRLRIARSGVSGKRLAQLLGVPQQNVSGWCTGVRPIPAHHVRRIIELTDNPPPRTEPAWRPPADLPSSRSKGATHRVAPSKVSRRRRAARAERPEAAPALLRSWRSMRPSQPAPKPHTSVHRPAPAAPVQSVDWSVMMRALSALQSLATPIDGNQVYSAGTTVPAMAGQVTGVSLGQRLAPVPQPSDTMRHSEPPQTGMAGPRHADFVAQDHAVLATIIISLSGLLRPRPRGKIASGSSDRTSAFSSEVCVGSKFPETIALIGVV